MPGWWSSRICRSAHPSKIGIPPTAFYRWFDRFVEREREGLEYRPSRPSRVWSRIPDRVRHQVVGLALQEPEQSPRILAVRFTDTEKYFVSQASVYRLLRAHDLITNPAYIVIEAAHVCKNKTNAPNQMRQTDFTYLKVIPFRSLKTNRRRTAGLGLVLPVHDLLAGNGMTTNHERPR